VLNEWLVRRVYKFILYAPLLSCIVLIQNTPDRRDRMPLWCWCGVTKFLPALDTRSEESGTRSTNSSTVTVPDTGGSAGAPVPGRGPNLHPWPVITATSPRPKEEVRLRITVNRCRSLPHTPRRVQLILATATRLGLVPCLADSQRSNISSRPPSPRGLDDCRQGSPGSPTTSPPRAHRRPRSRGPAPIASTPPSRRMASRPYCPILIHASGLCRRIASLCKVRVYHNEEESPR